MTNQYGSGFGRDGLMVPGCGRTKVMEVDMDGSERSDPRLLTHDLANVVGVVSSYAELLKQTELSADQIEMCDEMQDAADSAVRLCRMLQSRLSSEAADHGQ